MSLLILQSRHTHSSVSSVPLFTRLSFPMNSLVEIFDYSLSRAKFVKLGGGGRPLSTAIDYGPRGVCAERRCSRRCLFFFMMICIIWVYTGCVVCLCCVYGWLAVLYLIKVWLFILIYESFCRVWV